jgi:hypothetical protein
MDEFVIAHVKVQAPYVLEEVSVAANLLSRGMLSAIDGLQSRF